MPSACSGARTCGFAIFGLSFTRRVVFRGGTADGVNNRVVAGAATQIAADRGPDLVVGGVRNSINQVLRREEHARKAKAALKRILIPECFLQWGQLIAGYALERGDPRAVRRNRQFEAGLADVTVHQDRAGAAVTCGTSHLRAGR